MPIVLAPPTYPVSERELAVLRVLGRFGTVLGTTLHELVFPDQHEVTRLRLLKRLVEQKLIWQAAIPNASRDEAGRSRGRAPHVFGLTDDGKEALDTFNAEPHDGTYERLLARSRQAPSAPNMTAMFADTYISNWCAALIDQARRVPSLAGVHVQRRYAIIDTKGITLQTIGAVVILAFDKTARAFDRRGWELPWLSLGASPASWTYVRLALEIDSGQTALRTLFDMAQTYQKLTDANAYSQVLGGLVRPVLITPPARRARAVAEVWMGAWPGSPALLSTYERTAHPQYGPIWGNYMAVATNPPQAANLLGTLLGSVEQWPALTQQWSPSLAPAVARAASATPQPASA